jgi:hypothetical protein
MRLCYYQWPLKLKYLDNPKLRAKGAEYEIEKIHADYMADAERWHCGYRTTRVNAHSKFVWNLTRFRDEFRIYSHELRYGESYAEELSIRMTDLMEPYDLKTMEAAIVEMWEIREHELLLFCASSKHQTNSVNSETGVVNNTFIWDTLHGKIRESLFTLDPDFQDLQVDMTGSPQLSMFPTFMF